MLVDKDLKDVSLSSFWGKRKILNIVPSLDTPTCQASARKFNELASGIAEYRRAGDFRRPAVRAEPLLRRRRPEERGHPVHHARPRFQQGLRRHDHGPAALRPDWPARRGPR
jgi:hypothetical protein